MIKKITFLSFLLFSLGIGLDSHFNHAHTNPTGAPAGHTGSPGDNGLTCARSGCHASTATTGTNLFFVGVPAAGYNPGQTYLVQVNFSGTGNKGFQISPQNQAGALQGQLINTTNSGTNGTQTVGTKYVTHTLAQSGATGSWTFQWRAPNAGTGPVTFYGAFVNGRNNGLRLEQATIQENPAASVAENSRLKNFKIYPNPVTEKMTISYQLERNETVNIRVFDITGRESLVLLQQKMEAGEHVHQFDVREQLRAGVYFVTVEAGNRTLSQKMLVR
ncbi:MAG: choice-of-anchor V domain-containing protein [Bacteroidia bacterium]